MLPGYPPESSTGSEKQVFQLIRDAEGSSAYCCLASVGLARHKQKEYGEIDFVIVGPAGIFCLEVKGGEVHRQNGVWEIGWPGHTYTSREGPFRQVQSARWALAGELSARLSQDIRQIALIGWGVVFPDIRFDLRDTEWSSEVVYDCRDKDDSFIKYIRRLELYSRSRIKQVGGQQPPELSANQVRQITRLLRGDFDLVPSLSGLIAESQRELLSLSEDQFLVLDLALHDSSARLICDGPAGSGKTVIAAEAARRFAKGGGSVLVLCFNKQLALRLKQEINSPAVTVAALHEFFSRVIRDAGLQADLRSASVESSDDLFFKKYPGLFERACAVLLDYGELPQFDALVIDEGQDLLTRPVMDAIGLVLSEGLAAGRWAVFLDSSIQAAVYGRMDSATLDLVRQRATSHCRLRHNFRNPKKVVIEVCALTGAEPPICRRQFDAPVEYVTYGSLAEQPRVLEKTLRAILSGGAKPVDVAVLSPRQMHESCAFRLASATDIRFSFLEKHDGVEHGTVLVSSIAAFKGLEAEIVVLTDISPADSGDWSSAILYVGMTRARSQVYLIVDTLFREQRFRCAEDAR